MFSKLLLRSGLSQPLTRGRHVDSIENNLLRSNIIRKKCFLRKIYLRWYALIIKSLNRNIKGPLLELGSCGGFFKEFIPELITSDILRIPDMGVVLDGQHLPFSRESLRGIVMINVFHHLPEIESFLDDAGFCVKPGGTVVMIEPWVTNWSRIMYGLFHFEECRLDTKDWKSPAGGPLSGANLALPWIVFERDRKRFEQNFPKWQVERIELHEPFCYLLSGGVAFKSFMPPGFYDICRRLENIVRPWMHRWAMFATITLIRRKNE